MNKNGKPSIILRISHLIILNILFIFAALAILIFYPEKDNQIEDKFDELESGILYDAGRIEKVIFENSDFAYNKIDTSFTIDSLFDFEENYKSIEIIYFDSINQSYAVALLGGIKDESSHSYHDIVSIYSPFMESGTGQVSMVNNLSSDGRYIYSFVEPENPRLNHGLIFRTENDSLLLAGNKTTYLLLIIFLVTTLNSLLIIYLAKLGIEKPINGIIKGFDQILEGKQIEIEPSSDRNVNRLIDSFNQMSSSLTEKRTELEKANRRLTLANNTLAESESILTALVNYSPESILVTDRSNRVILCNLQAESDFGVGYKDFSGKLITDLIQITPFRFKGIIIGRDTIAETQEVICEKTDGTRFPSYLIRIPLGLEGSAPTAVLYFVKDISESDNYRDMIMGLDRVATRGAMARDIAHEINNYLAVLQGNLELIPILMENGNEKKVLSKTDVMRDTVAKITRFTEGLTRFSDENSSFEKEDLNQLIENLVAFLKPQNKYDSVKFKTSLTDRMPLVEVDAGQLQLLMVNLISNAAEMFENSEERCVVEINTTVLDDKKSFRIEMIDNGPGIDPEYLDDLFTRRFTTRRDGYGIGLMTCKNIVDNHNGTIWYDRIEDSKTVFTVELPIRQDQLPDSEKERTQNLQSV